MFYKRSLVLVLSLFIIVVSCTKSSDNLQPQLNSTVLPGVWEYRNRVGGDKPFTPDEFKPGNGNLWMFTADSFQRISKETVQRSGSYFIANTGIDPNSGKHVSQFIFNGDSLDVFELRDDTLRFYYGFIPADGDIEMYVKIADDATANVIH